jgi:hypothetical protein
MKLVPSEQRGSRCPICFWGLYDGDWCQGPKWCSNRGKSVDMAINLSNAEAAKMIAQYCPTCGRHRPCRVCRVESLLKNNLERKEYHCD